MLQPKSFEIKRLDKYEATREYPNLWLTAEKLLPELTGDELALVVSLAADTCQVCHAANGSCQCWNDE